MSDAMVRTENVHKSFGRLEVLKGIDVEVRPGGVCVVVGPSGSGKSTLLRCINHLEKIDAGRIWVDGELIGYRQRGDKLHELKEKEVAAQRRDIGMVFQQFNLFAHKTVLQNVTLGPIKVRGHSKSEAKERGMELLARVGIEAQASKLPAQLSGGQQQRVAIARSLAMDPKVMLFDEPTSALDPIATARIEELIDELRANYTIVIVTHNMQQAARVSDRTAFFTTEVNEEGNRTGRLVEFDRTEKIFTAPSDQRTEDYITGRFG